MEVSDLPTVRQFVSGEAVGPLTDSVGYEVNDIVT
jgi:hypothetical protein